ncbi:MAG: pseudouridine synthase [Myxococcales bacterium]|nr:pseudouridine synthase [Myxococcales bacterium]
MFGKARPKMRAMRKQLLLLVALSLVTTVASAAEPKKVVAVEGITEYALDNGMRVLLFPDNSKPNVTINVTYLVGSRHEGYGETGMAHLLEHMLFKGTTRHQKIWAELDNHGARFNGSTWYDRTNYFETLNASDDNLKWALDMEADRMINSRVSKEDLSTEFSVVRNEFEMGENSPGDVLEERLYSTAYLWHNYGKSTIGSRSDIEKVPIENLQAFYRRFYQPDNAILIVAGKIDPAKTLALISSTFGKIARPTRKLSPTYTTEPVQDGERSVTLRRSGDIGVVGLVYHGAAGADADFVAEEALADILTHKPTGRLYKALVDKGLASKVDSDVLPLAEPGLIKLSAEVPATKSLDSVRDKMIATVEGLAKGDIGQDEIDRFKTFALKRIELGLTDSARVGVELSEWAAQGDWRLIFLHRDAVKALDAARVKKVAAAYLKSSNRTVGVFIPTKTLERAPLPAQPDVVGMVKSYKGQETLAAGEEFQANIPNIEKRTERASLASGMKLALLSKKTRGGAVKIILKINAGSEKDLKGLVDAANLLPDIVQRGTKKHTYQQLRDELDKLKAELRAGSQSPVAAARPGEATFSVTTVRESVPAVLALLGEMVREPSFPKDEFEKLRKEKVARIEDSLQQPQAIAFTTLLSKALPYAKDDVRYRPSLKERLERLKAIKLAEVAAFHKGFWGASAGELVMVGDFDAAEVKKLAEKEFGAWKSPRPWTRVTMPWRAAQVADELILTPDKQMAMVGIGGSFAMRDDDGDFPAMTMVDFLFGGSAKSRLFERLRQKDGLSYGAGSMFNADSLDKNSLFVAFAICAPQNAVKAMAAMLEELAGFASKGVDAKELAEAKQAYQAQWQTQLASDDVVAGLLEESIDVGRKLEFYDKLNAAVQALSAPQVGAAMAKYVKADALVKVKAGDIKN